MTRTLLLHIGTGKTGSTAIQRFLARHCTSLRGMGVHYWGLNLERTASAPAFGWQRADGIRQLQRLAAHSARGQLREALRRAVDDLPDGATAVWSNESIHERPDVYLPLLTRLRDEDGIGVIPIAYVRNHRDYARSAYLQWGIRHKSYPGRIMGFEAWTSARAEFLCYGRSLVDWEAAFPGWIRVVNYDAVDDVVGHFARLLPAEAHRLPSERRLEVNASLSTRMLALFALFNNLSPGAVDPREFEMLLSRQPMLKDGQHPELVPLSALVPRDAALDRAEALLEDDVARVSGILERQGEPPFGSAADARRAAREDVDFEALAADLLSTLMRVVVAQDQSLHGRRERSDSSWSKRLIETFRGSPSPPAPMVPQVAEQGGCGPSGQAPVAVRIRGSIDRLDDRAVVGWVMIEDQPSLKPIVELIWNGRVIATAIADGYRPDLHRASISDGSCEFRIKIPPDLPADAIGPLKVRIAGGIAYLRPRSDPSGEDPQ